MHLRFLRHSAELHYLMKRWQIVTDITTTVLYIVGLSPKCGELSIRQFIK